MGKRRLKSSRVGYWRAKLHWNPAWESFIRIGVISVIGVIMDYITKKFPRHLVGRLRSLKARMELKGARKVTEADVFALALARLEEEMGRERRYSLLELAGSLKGKAKSNAQEIDRVVYGI